MSRNVCGSLKGFLFYSRGANEVTTLITLLVITTTDKWLNSGKRSYYGNSANQKLNFLFIIQYWGVGGAVKVTQKRVFNICDNMLTNIQKTYIARNKRLNKKKLSYNDFLKSNFWLETKEYINTYRKEEYSKCYVCGNKRENLHHWSYRHIFNKSFKKRCQHIIPLCEKHHHEVHQISNKNNNLGLKQITKQLKNLWITQIKKENP